MARQRYLLRTLVDGQNIRSFRTWNNDRSANHEGARTTLHLQYVVRGGPTNVDSLRELQCVSRVREYACDRSR